MPHPAIATWHHLFKTRNPAGLDDLLAEDAVFLSPIVHSPQRGKALTRAYLHAAFEVFFNDSFRYVRELIGENDAMLEFETEIDGVLVNGKAPTKWDASGKTVEFKGLVKVQSLH